MSRRANGVLPTAPRLIAAALVAVFTVPGVVLWGQQAPAHAAPRAELAVGVIQDESVRAEQWPLTALDIATAWREATGAGITVAVVDSGVDANHPDLVDQVLPGVDLVDEGGDGRTDPVGHGTTVAALIAGHNDEVGVAGIAPDARILPIRVLDEENRYDDAVIIAKAVRWAVDNGARVINLSLGGLGSSPALAAALDYAFVKDVVVIACTGNISASATPEVWYPAREPGVVAVTGLERDGQTPWSGSITGPETVISAPATELVGARPGGYWRVQGTSFAAPMVSATAALIRSRWPTMSAASVINQLVRTANDLGEPGRDDRFGYGIINPVAALTRGLQMVDRNLLDTEPPPGETGFGEAPEKNANGSTTLAGGMPFESQAPAAQPGWAAQPAARTPERQNLPYAGGPGLVSLAVTALLALSLTVWRLSRRPSSP